MSEAKTPIRIGIIGFGNIGLRHAKIILENPAFSLVAICDVKSERKNQIPEGCSFYLEIGDLLKEEALDIVSICTPNGLHVDHAIQCLQAGVNTLVEKPLALSTQDCLRITEVQEITGKQVFTVMQNRFNPAVIFAKRLLDNDTLGSLLSIQVNCFWNRGDSYYENSDWHGKKDLDGGILFTQFSHFMDILIHFLGKSMTVDFGFIQNRMHQYCSEVEDQGLFVLHSDNCPISFNYSINATNQNMEGSILLMGSKGTIKVGGKYMNRIDYLQLERDYNIAEIEAINHLPVNNNQYGGYQGSMSNHDKVFQNLADHLLDGKPYYTSLSDGIAVVEIIESMYKTVKHCQV